MGFIGKRAGDAFPEVLLEPLSIGFQGDGEELFGYARIEQIDITFAAIPGGVAGTTDRGAVCDVA